MPARAQPLPQPRGRRQWTPPLPINRPAQGPAPMMELTLIERAALTRIRKSGPRGVAIGDDLLVTTAIRLGLVGLVWIDKDTPQRVRMKRFER
jgi:hypothetical protein